MTKQEPPTELTLWLTAAIDKWRETHPDVMASEIFASFEDIRHTLTEALLDIQPTRTE
jgi:hypothetical protein